MGILSKLWKGVKSVFGGILKVFEPILAPIAKALDTGLGKAIMIGLSIFTLGTSLLAGGQAFMAGLGGSSGSFINAFVEGGKQFMTTMVTGEGFQGAKSAADAAGQTMQATAEGVGQALETGGVPGIVGQTGPEAAGSMAMGPGPTGDVMTKAVTGGAPGQAGQVGMLPPEAMTPAKTVAETAAKTTAPAKEGSWLSKAAKAGGDFIKSEGGGQVAGSLISAAGNYYTEKDRQEFVDRNRRQWGRGEADAGIRSMRDTEARVGQLEGPSAQGIARTSRTTARTDPGESRPEFLLPAGG